MIFIVILSQLLLLNRPRNCILLCLKEGHLWERSNKQYPFFPSAFYMLQKGPILSPSLRQHQGQKNQKSLRTKEVYFIWVYLISTLVFKSCRHQACPALSFFPPICPTTSPAAAGILLSPLAVMVRWFLLPKSCPTLQMWERKEFWWMETLYRHLVHCRGVNSIPLSVHCAPICLLRGD